MISRIAAPLLLPFAPLMLAAAEPAEAPAEKPAAEAAEGTKIELAEGAVTLTMPAAWEKREPRTRIVEFEFAAPPAEGSDVDGRITIMGAGGSVEANLDRWVAQFAQADGGSTRDRAKFSERETAGCKVHVADIAGDFKDQPRGPLGPTETREDYRMLGAIIVTPKYGQYYVKFYGPSATIAKHEEAFHAMLGTLEVKAAE